MSREHAARYDDNAAPASLASSSVENGIHRTLRRVALQCESRGTVELLILHRLCGKARKSQLLSAGRVTALPEDINEQTQEGQRDTRPTPRLARTIPGPHPGFLRRYRRGNRACRGGHGVPRLRRVTAGVPLALEARSTSGAPGL
jgi:hypothetical protein